MRQMSLTTKHAIGILGAVCVFLYANTLPNQLFWDDFDSIVNNQAIKSFANVEYMFTHSITDGAGVASNYWRPLLALSFAFDYSVAELAPWMYHLQSLLWHVLAAIGVFLCIRLFVLSVSAALAGALLWAVHPIHVEAVTYVAGRADPMHGALLFFALYLWVRFVRGEDGTGFTRREFFAWSLVLFIAALLVKERAIVFVGVLGLYGAYAYVREWRSRVFVRRYALHMSAFVAVAAVYTVLRMTVFDFLDTFDVGTANIIGAEHWWHYLYAYAQGIALYAGLIVWPQELTMERAVMAPGHVTMGVVAGAMIFCAAATAVWCSIRHRWLVAFGLLFFAGTLSPSIHVYPIQGLLYEHWLYVPLFGLAVIVAVLWNIYIPLVSENIRYVAWAGLIVVVVLLGVRTIVRNADWREPIRFYEKTVVMTGGSARVFNNLGMAYSDVEQYDDALRAYQKAAELEDSIFPPWFNMGNIYIARSAYEQAHDMFAQARAREPEFSAAYHKDALVYLEQNEYDAALEILSQARTVFSQDPQTLMLMAAIEEQRSNVREALVYAREALTYAPRDANIRDFVRSLEARLRQGATDSTL